MRAMPSNDSTTPRRDWNDLELDEQTRFLEEYGHYLDSLPPTCSMETKIDRLKRWLAGRGIDYRG